MKCKWCGRDSLFGHDTGCPGALLEQQQQQPTPQWINQTNKQIIQNQQWRSSVQQNWVTSSANWSVSTSTGYAGRVYIIGGGPWFRANYIKPDSREITVVKEALREIMEEEVQEKEREEL